MAKTKKTMSLYHGIQWVVQKNLTDPGLVRDLELACKQLGVDFYSFDIIPFSPSLPEIPTGKRSIFYGSTTTMYLVYRDERFNAGLFFNESTFSMANYLAHWGEYMLNSGARVVTLSEVNALDIAHDQLVFVRPDADSKSFSGTVKRFDELKEWFERLKISESENLDAHTKVLIGKPYQIEREWRLWIIEKKVVAASQYRKNFNLEKEPGCPSELIAFAEARCATYTPHDLFVMDIGLCGGELYVIECGCMNSAGFYSADVAAIVRSVTAYFDLN